MKALWMIACGLAALVHWAMPMPARAQQITVTPPAEVAVLMTACTPIGATGPDVRDTLIERGWISVEPDERLDRVRGLSGALLWFFYPMLLDEERIENLDLVIDGLGRAADAETASLLGLGDEVALILWNGDNLSCIWAGPQTEAVDRLASHIGGFPPSEGVTTAALSQTVEAGGRDWARRMSVARTPVADLPADVADFAITDAARLDRSPH